MTSTEQPASKQSLVVDVTPMMLSQWLEAGETVAVDVREDYEHEAERINDMPLHPLGKLDPESIRRDHAGKRVVFYCRTGRRSKQAADKYRQGNEKAFHLAGGIEGWKAAGQTVISSPGAPKYPIMQQVQIVGGTLVLIGVLLAVFVPPWFLLLSGIVGTGLVFAGLSGGCGMAKMLARMPWNRRAASCRNDPSDSSR